MRIVRVHAATLLLLAACTPDDARTPGAVATPAPAASASGPPVALVARTSAAHEPLDSAIAGALARFRDGLPRREALVPGASSADALVRELMAGLARADTAALVRLHVTRSEWAWLLFPESRHARPPYRQRPEIAWMLLSERSNSGLARLLDRRGGRFLALEAWRCDASEAEGRNRYWSRCMVTWRTADGSSATERLFGTIVERDGRFRVASYANQF